MSKYNTKFAKLTQTEVTVILNAALDDMIEQDGNLPSSDYDNLAAKIVQASLELRARGAI